MVGVRELDLNEFLALKNVWNKLLQKSRDNNIFSTWEWLGSWWKHFGEGRDFRVLIAQESEQVYGIAPLMLSKYSFLGFGKLRRMEFVGCPQSDYNSFILLKKEKECLRLFLNYLAQSRDWDLLDLVDIPKISFSANALKDIKATENSRLKFRTSTLCPYITLPSSTETLVSNLSRNMRKNLRKRMQRLREDYTVEIGTQNVFDSIDKAMEIFFDLHQKRWKSQRKPGVFASKAIRDFHTDVARAFNEQGWLAMYFLIANDKPVAAIYSFDYNLKKYGYLTGFDPDFESYGVGNLLKMHAVEDSIKKGFKEYDLARGFEPYKANWSTGVRENFAVWMTHEGLAAKMYDLVVRNSLLQRILGSLGHISLRES